MDTKEERIKVLQTAIESDATPDHVKDKMKKLLDELLSPPPPPPPPKPVIKKKLPPPPPPKPPKRIFADGEKEIIREEYLVRIKRKKSNII